MSKIILNFGDSWAHAGDAGTEHGYANVVARQLNCELQDYSIPSTSIPRMILQFQTFLDQKYTTDCEYIALFFVTAVERLTFFDQRQPYDIWPQSFEDFYANWYSDQYGEFVANISLITLQTMCKARNIKDVYIPGWQTPALWPDVDSTKFLNGGFRCIAQDFGGQGEKPLYDLINRRDSTYLIQDNWHPNQNGHRFIADSILQHLELDRRYIQLQDQ